MSTIPIPGGTYSDSPHEYRDTAGDFVPSITQILSLCGLNNYFNGNSDVMQNAARRGSEVHALAAMYGKYGDVDPTWMTNEIQPYFDAYQKFVQDTGFKCDKNWVEVPMIAEVYGMKYGVTPDALGCRGQWPQIVELKCSSTVQPAWAIQTAAQEMAWFDTKQVGRAKRMAVMLKPDGNYKVDVHEHHRYDAHVFVSALSCVWFRIAAGQKVWERI